MATQDGFLGLTIPAMEDQPNAEVLFENFRIVERFAENISNEVGLSKDVVESIKGVVGV